MIYPRIKGWLLEVLKAPHGPPEPPPGTPGSAEVFRAAPNFLRLRLLVWGGGFASAILIEIALVIAGPFFEWLEWLEGTLEYVLVTLTVLGALGKYFLIRLEYDMRYYIVTDRCLRVREGAVVIHESTFTYANVQNLRIEQGPLERLLGISNLVVQTAGGAGRGGDERGEPHFRGGHEGVLRGVSNAVQVRDRILLLLRRYRDAGLGDPEDRRVLAASRRTAPAVPPVAVDRLREIRDELRALTAQRP